MNKTTAKEIMSTELLKAREGMSVEECLRLLVNSRITGMPVVDDKGRMVGVVSEYDLIVQLAERTTTQGVKSEVFQEPIEFSRKAQVVKDTSTLEEVISVFVKQKVRRLPVVDKKNTLIGIITRRDLMRLFYYRAKLA